MSPAVILLLRHSHDVSRSRELLELAAALAVFALPVSIVCLASPEGILSIGDGDVRALLNDLPGYGSVSLFALAEADQHGFTALDEAGLQAMLSAASSVIGD